MVSFHDIDTLKLNKALASELKSIDSIQPPEWSEFVKTGAHKAQTPVEQDWWYNRGAAILITVAKIGPVGTNKLRVKFGGKKRRGYKPSEFRKGSGSIARKLLQQLEGAKLLEQKETARHKGRVVSSQGSSLIAKAAKTVQK
jgi:small subunit ribosomal protein S19e